jgi:hypothetical protein
MNPALEALNSLHSFSYGSPQRDSISCKKRHFFVEELSLEISFYSASLDQILVIFLPLKEPKKG